MRASRKLHMVSSATSKARNSNGNSALHAKQIAMKSEFLLSEFFFKTSQLVRKQQPHQISNQNFILLPSVNSN